jgi:hypothetical protein
MGVPLEKQPIVKTLATAHNTAKKRKRFFLACLSVVQDTILME